MVVFIFTVSDEVYLLVLLLVSTIRSIVPILVTVEALYVAAALRRVVAVFVTFKTLDM